MPEGCGKAPKPAGTSLHMMHRVIGIIFICSVLQPLAAIDRIGFDIDRLEYNRLVAEDVAVDWIGGAGEDFTLRISAARLSLPAAGGFEQVAIDCKSGSLTATVLHCREGLFRVSHKDHGKIQGNIDMDYHLDGSKGEIRLSAIAAGEGDISGSVIFDPGGWHGTLQGNRLGLSWLRQTLEPYGFWPADYSDESGSVAINVAVHGSRSDLHRLEGVLHTQDVGFYGINAAEEFTGTVNFDIDARDGWRIKADGNLESGAVFVEPGITVGNIRPGIALELSEHPLWFSIDTKFDDSLQKVAIRKLDIDHAGIMTANVQADVVPGETITIPGAAISLSALDSGKFYTTWLQPFLLETLFNALETAGTFKAGAGVKDNELMDLELVFDDFHAYDGNGRFHIAGLEGSLVVNEESAPVSSVLSWNGAGVYRLDTGAAKLELVSGNREVKVVSWEDVPVLGGELRINTLNISDFAREDMAIRLDGELTPIAMADFTRAMGWPIMSGELTGTIEGLTYKHGKLEVNGQINVGLFDGNIVVRNLSIEDLFGLVPVLRADIDIRSLDLELLTNRFSFGYIQGRLGGKVHKLELQAWRPVYFEAELMTPAEDNSRHRISQQAVDNLGYLGGGAINALSKGFLRFFQEYSYGRLGISCRLFNGVCELGGVKETGNGFVIVSRGGLFPPWIEVIGTGHSIAWPVLVEGLKTIATKSPEFR